MLRKGLSGINLKLTLHKLQTALCHCCAARPICNPPINVCCVFDPCVSPPRNCFAGLGCRTYLSGARITDG
jgi:hypothetical protein